MTDPQKTPGKSPEKSGGETITLREADVREKLAQLEDERFK